MSRNIKPTPTREYKKYPALMFRWDKLIDLFCPPRKVVPQSSVKHFEVKKNPVIFTVPYVESKKEKLHLIRMGRRQGAHGKSKRQQILAWS